MGSSLTGSFFRGAEAPRFEACGPQTNNRISKSDVTPRIWSLPMVSAESLRLGSQSRRKPKRREGAISGLAMLELVLALPLLLLMMALIINFGTVAAWKVRGLAVARHAAWSNRWPRSASQLPRPEYWPTSAALGVSQAAPLATGDDPRLHNPAIRGPLPNGFVVRDQLLNPARGVTEGFGHLRRRLPLVTSTRPYELAPRTQVMEYFWDHAEMGLFSTFERRTQALYELPRAPAVYSEAYRQAAMAILTADFRADLAPLDRDDEFLFYARRFGWQTGAPDFHPALRRFCSLDHSVAQTRVDHLIIEIEGQIVADSEGNRQRIGGVPQRIVQAFIHLYTQVIHQLTLLLDGGGLPPDESLAIRGEISDLQNRITHLQAFLNELRNAVD